MPGDIVGVIYILLRYFMLDDYPKLTYQRKDSAVFCRTKDMFGGLSNMAGGFPLSVNGAFIRTSEALYQACRFPHSSEIQKSIFAENSPMGAKMVSKSFIEETRSDWNDVRISIMYWCLQVKLCQNWNTFGELLLSTEDLLIVEQSRHDDFWGAFIKDSYSLHGQNVLGWLLMELREILKSNPISFETIAPLPIHDFLILGKPVQPIVFLI